MTNRTWIRRFLPVWAVGALGVASLLLQGVPAALFEQAPQLRDLPPMAVRAMLLVNPLLLMTVLAAVGATLAHRVELSSRLAGDRSVALALGPSVLAGFAVATVLAIADAAWVDALGPQWQKLVAEANAAPPWRTLAIGLLYGGLTEEVMMRWGVMSLVAWALWRLHRGSNAAASGPSPGVMWTAIVVSALVFALGHLPALAQSASLSPALVTRTLVLNAAGGVVFGWLFWRRGLESAMVAHASTHVGLAVARALA